VRKAGEIADIGFKAMLDVVEWESDCDVWTACEGALTGLELSPFIFALCSGPGPKKSGFTYGPMNRILQKGDIVFNELRPLMAAIGQLCRAIVLGEPSDDFKRAYDAQSKYTIWRKRVEKGNTVSELEGKARALLLERLFLLITLQHIGLQITEESQGHDLQTGYVFCESSMDRISTRYERSRGHIIGDTLIVTEDAPEHVRRYL